MNKSSIVPSALTRRREYTAAHNSTEGRHGWLRLTPAYSVQLVEELLTEHGSRGLVLDPFGGTGTTALCASALGHPAISCDINPFLLWLSNAKFAQYSERDFADALEASASIAGSLSGTDAEDLPVAPPMRNIERWWSSDDLLYLRHIRAGITDAAISERAKDLLRVAFCRVLIQSAHLTKRHQSLSFRKGGAQAQINLDIGDDPLGTALADVCGVLGDNPPALIKSINSDARFMTEVPGNSVDIVVTSPPYPNRMTAIRELRPYMYWFGFLVNPQDAGQLDWKAIGGTWGAATSKLCGWEPRDSWKPPQMIDAVANRIATSARKDGDADGVNSSVLMAKYVLRYFHDLSSHIDSLRRVLKPGAKVNYVIGNSSFYGHLVQTEKALAEILVQAGFKDVSSRAIRKRNSKAELFEFVVQARLP